MVWYLNAEGLLSGNCYLKEEIGESCSDLSYRKCGGGWKCHWIVSEEQVLTLLIKETVIVNKGKISFFYVNA
jgi:hypothetical protein